MSVMSPSSWSKPRAVEQDQTFSDSPGKKQNQKNPTLVQQEAQFSLI